MTSCTPECWSMPECVRCGMSKKPRGRDAGVYASNSYCGPGCPGYYEAPQPGHWWPDEEPDLRADAMERAKLRFQHETR